jgi:glycosyltransferase involved in cell wall biosynthesis
MRMVPRPASDPFLSGALARVSVLWHGPLFGPGGYDDEGRQFVLGLDAAGVRVRIVPFHSGDARAALPGWELARLRELSATSHGPSPGPCVSIFHTSPGSLWRPRGAAYYVARTMFETDGLPAKWVAACNRMDEVWVPSAFNLESFSRAGVARHKLHRVPEGIDVERFSGSISPLPIPGRRRFNFLSVFDWHLRKGWDVLLRSFIEEFTPSEDVALIIKVCSPLEHIRQEARVFLRRHDLARELPSHVVLYHANLDAGELPRLYKAADAFVLPTRGEGWGRPFMEAMLMERPVIATRYGGQLEFLNDENAYLLDCRLAKVSRAAATETPVFGGGWWAEPSRVHLRRLLREVFEDREVARRRGREGRQSIMANFSRERVAHHVALQLQRIAENLAGRDHRGGGVRTRHAENSDPRDGLTVVWEGAQFVYHSLALVNRELSMQLLDAGHALTLRGDGLSGGFALEADQRWQRLVDRLWAPLHRPADFHVGHQWPPNLVSPAEGQWVVFQPWEFGSLPKVWFRTFSTEIDEVWVPSQHVRQGYTDSGIPPDRVFVVPCGVNPQRFHPKAERRTLARVGAFRFLFVGGTIWRKGIDVLLEAYLKAFRKSDDVGLVIKDMGGKSFYKGQTFKNEILALRRRRDAPPILYLDSDLREDDMPGLYRACDTLVHPYRGEGFGLPILEAMACGVPAIVTNGGACLDFCSEENSVLVHARKKNLPNGLLGDYETVKSPWVYEVDVGDLIEKMRHAYEHPAEMKALGMKASEDVHAQWTWRHSGTKVLQRFEALRRRPVRRRRLFPLPAEPQDGPTSSRRNLGA